MTGVSVSTNMDQMVIDIAAMRADITDTPKLLAIAGELMRASVVRTFRDEGSPAGSWPRLALSTMRRKGYTAGHKLLILSGRLFGSISYVVTGNTLTIGTNLAYAAVQQLGSADRLGGSIGPQARIAGRDVIVPEHSFQREREIHYTTREVIGKDGNTYRVPTAMRNGRRVVLDKNGRERTVNAAYQGPHNVTRGLVSLHSRFQNIPARPYLVIRPEDPQRIMWGFEEYLSSKWGRTGMVTA